VSGTDPPEATGSNIGANANIYDVLVGIRLTY
jgi:hypothetical protein